jgi:hypothetical protein
VYCNEVVTFKIPVIVASFSSATIFSLSFRMLYSKSRGA